MIDWDTLVAPKNVAPREGQSRVFAYGLIDPRTLLIRYVGMTTKGMQRPRSHANPSELRKATAHKNAWLKQLLAAGLDYTIVVLEAVADKEALEEAERWWIAFGRACGWPLTNETPGGEGRPWPRGKPLPPEHLAKLRGRKQDPEHVAKRVASRKGHWHSAEARESIAAALRGRKLTLEHRAKVSASLIGNTRAARKR